MAPGAVGGKTAVAFVGHVHIERNLFMSLDRTSSFCDLCALDLKIRQSSKYYGGTMGWWYDVGKDCVVGGILFLRLPREWMQF